jgi:hypothetical protein
LCRVAARLRLRRRGKTHPAAASPAAERFKGFMAAAFLLPAIINLLKKKYLLLSNIKQIIKYKKMKKILVLSVLMLATVLAGCSKDDDKDKEDDFVPGKFSLTIENLFSSDVVYGFTEDGSSVILNTIPAFGDGKVGAILERGKEYIFVFSAPLEDITHIYSDPLSTLPSGVRYYFAADAIQDGVYVSSYVLDLKSVKADQYPVGDPALNLSVDLSSSAAMF